MAFHSTMAQKDSLAFDDQGKYTYYKLVNAGNNTADVLYARALVFLKSAYSKNTLKLAGQNVKDKHLGGEGILLVSKKSSLAKHDDGRINCKLNIDVKEGKYRYWFTDFVFTPYTRDRNNNFVPVPSQEIDMEKAATKFDNKDVDHYLDECGKFAKQVGAELQKYMVAAPIAKKDTVVKKVIHIDKW